MTSLVDMTLQVRALSFQTRGSEEAGFESNETLQSRSFRTKCIKLCKRYNNDMKILKAQPLEVLFPVR